MNLVFQRSASLKKAPPTAGSMPTPLLFREDKSQHRKDSLKTQSLHDPKQENVMGTLDAALHRIAQRRQSEIAMSSSSDQKSVHSMIERRRAPRLMGQSLTMPRSKDDHEHRRTKSSDLNMFTIKWNKGPTKNNRRESIEFEGDFDTDDWDSDADDSESKSSRPLTTLEQALTFRSLAWNPGSDDDEASQSSMSCSSVSSTMSKSRGRRPRLIRSGSLKDTSSKAIEYMQHRSCLQQSLLRVKNTKPKRRHSSDEMNLNWDKLDKKNEEIHARVKNTKPKRRHSSDEMNLNWDKLDKKDEEILARRLARQKSDRSKDGSETKRQDSSSHQPARRKPHESSDDSNANKRVEKSSHPQTAHRSTKTPLHGSSGSSKVSKVESNEENKSHPRTQSSMEKHSKNRKEKTDVKKSDALRSSKSSQRRSSSTKTESCDVHKSSSKKKDTGSSDTTNRQKEHKSNSKRITDILATPNLTGNDDSPWNVTRQHIALRSTNRV